MDDFWPPNWMFFWTFRSLQGNLPFHPIQKKKLTHPDAILKHGSKKNWLKKLLPIKSWNIRSEYMSGFTIPACYTHTLRSSRTLLGPHSRHAVAAKNGFSSASDHRRQIKKWSETLSNNLLCKPGSRLQCANLHCGHKFLNPPPPQLPFRSGFRWRLAQLFWCQLCTKTTQSKIFCQSLAL